MADIRRLAAPAAGIRRPNLRLLAPMTHTLAFAGISAAALMPLSAVAADQAAEEATLSTIKVEEKVIDPNPNAEVGAPYKARTSGDSRYTRPLAEIPQTIQVITQAAIDDSGKTDLRDILGAQPGITLGVGENGNMFGDNYVIRGQSAKSDIFVDGLRDPGMNTRESFAIEQVEITKGPDSSFAGRGSAGGAVNTITKEATLDYDFAGGAAGLGTDSYQRYSADINRAIGDRVAVRVNALWGDEHVPDRAPAGRTRQGIALSGLYEARKDLSVTVDFYGLRANNSHYDAGGWLVGIVPDRVPATVMPPHAQDGEFLRSNSDTGTVRIKWNLAPGVTLDSRTRYGKSQNAYAFSTATYNTVAAAAVINDQHNRWQDVRYFAQQDNLRWDNKFFRRKNETVFTVEYTDHHVDQGVYNPVSSNPFNCRTAAGSGANNAYCVTTPGAGLNGAPLPNIQRIRGIVWTRGGKNYDWTVKTVSGSAMDTLDVTSKFTVFAGLRLDRILDFTAIPLNATTGAIAAGPYNYKDTLLNYWGGLDYKLTPDAIIYLGFGSGQDINGGEPDSGTSVGYGGLIIPPGATGVVTDVSKPETSSNIELGIKWNLLKQKLLATAAVFRTLKTDVMESTNTAEFATTGTTNTGANRVQGAEVGLVGNVTRKLSVTAGAAFMTSKITRGNAASAALIGHELANFANQTFMVQARYQLSSAFDFGGTLRHESDRCGGQPDTGVSYTNGQCAQPVPSFTVGDVFASYRINKHFQLRANVTNVTNKDYYTGVYRSGNWLTIGDKRRSVLSFEMEY